MGLLEASYQKELNDAVLKLTLKGLTRIQAEGIAKIALEYRKPDRGKYGDKTN